MSTEISRLFLIFLKTVLDERTIVYYLPQLLPKKTTVFPGKTLCLLPGFTRA